MMANKEFLTIVTKNVEREWTMGIKLLFPNMNVSYEKNNFTKITF